MRGAIVLSALSLLFLPVPGHAAGPLPVRMTVPGFTVRELPVELTNINNLEYAPDGRLFAVGYDGRIHILTDTNGDGLEDTSKEFYAPKATDLRAPVGMAIAPEGIYVASKGRISLLRDPNNDGVADSCEMVVGGWPELFVAVDSLGVAVDKDNNLYYGRGCHDFTNPLQIDKKTGKAGYSLKQETGTIINEADRNAGLQIGAVERDAAPLHQGTGTEAVEVDLGSCRIRLRGCDLHDHARAIACGSWKKIRNEDGGADSVGA